MGRPAAFFDLDRTLLAGASGPAFAEALEGLGTAPPRVPAQALLLRLYERFGESFAVMQLAKRGAGRIRDLDQTVVAAAANAAAPLLEAAVLPYVRPLLRQHRERDELVVLATTSPRDLVTPLAERLGFDSVVATDYEVIGGRYTGELSGEFVWGPGKLRAVQQFATAADVDLSASWAYSDSVFDYPLLAAVGHPVAVNPDPRLIAVAALRRWPVRHLDVPPGVQKLVGFEAFDVVKLVARPELIPYADLRFAGLGHVPAAGPAIIAANHRSYFDPLALAAALARRGRAVRFLGKREVFDAPVVGAAARLLGAIPVDRGSGSDEPLRAAAAVLTAGDVVAIMPQGTIPRGDAFHDRVLVGRPGVARLAKMSGAPVIPAGLWGTERVWPRQSKVPIVWNVARPPEVTVGFGPAVQGLRGRSEKADTTRVMAAIMALLPNDAADDPSDSLPR